jgi:hypothetical protein
MPERRGQSTGGRHNYYQLISPGALFSSGLFLAYADPGMYGSAPPHPDPLGRLARSFRDILICPKKDPGRITVAKKIQPFFCSRMFLT